MALWQANHIRDQLIAHHPHLQVSLVPMTSEGDQTQDKPLAEVGGKSLFVKTLQTALLNGEADIAVHCVKDMSVHPTPDLTLACICKRDDPRDVLVSPKYADLNALPPNSVVGTSSPRRQALLLSAHPQLQIRLLRGNVNTRLKKLDAGEYDAIILAAAGLHRLGFENRITAYLDPKHFVPAIAQGALGIECRSDNASVVDLLTPLHDPDTALCINTERRVNQVLGGSCFTPIGAYATTQKHILTIRAIVGATDGSKILTATEQGPRNNALTLAEAVANTLLTQGAKSLYQ